MLQVPFYLFLLYNCKLILCAFSDASSNKTLCFICEKQVKSRCDRVCAVQKGGCLRKQLLSFFFLLLAQNSEITAKPTIALCCRVRHMIYWRCIKYWPAVLHDVRKSSFLVLESSVRITFDSWAKGHSLSFGTVCPPMRS